MFIAKYLCHLIARNHINFNLHLLCQRNSLFMITEQIFFTSIKDDMMKITISLISLLLVFSVEAAHRGYIVKLKNGVNKDAFLSSKSAHNLGHIEKQLSLSFGDFLVVNPGSEKSLMGLTSNPEIEYIEPNYIIALDTIIDDNKEIEAPSDNHFSKQWGLENTGRNSSSWLSRGVKGMDINAKEAWKVTKGDREVRIAVIDTGVDYEHKDLQGNLMINEQELNGTEGVDDDGNGYVDDVYGYDFANKDGSPMDGHGHGTHCAGVIGAVHNNGGVAGVMSNVKILSIKFLSDSGSGETIDAIASIDYAIKRGVHVMSNSWGGGERSEALKESIQRARDAGITFVAAAGNSFSNNDKKPTYPANYQVENVITVAAMSGNGKKSSFSNYGATSVHVMAPGSGILSTVNKNGYQKMSGTSMATPFVSGVVGLLLSHEPNLTPEEVKQRLINTSKVTGALDDVTVSNGRVDAYRALKNITSND